MLKFKFYLLCFFIINTLSCIKSSVNYLSDTNCKAAFVVDEVTGSLSISDETALPEKFTLQLHACMRSYGKIETKLPSTHWVISTDKNIISRVDASTKLKKLISLSTNLDNEKNNIIQMTTNGDGCVTWTEEYNYAHSPQSQWIILDRYIKGISNEYPGVCKIPLAVNPWLQLKKYANIQIADYRKKYHKNNNNLKNRVKLNGLSFLKKQQKKEQKNKVNIIVNELTLYVDGSDSKSNTRILHGNIIKSKVTYAITDVHGNQKENQLNHGDFDIKTSLLINEKSASGQTQRYLKMNEPMKNKGLIDTRFEEKILSSLPFDWTIPYESYNSRIALYLKVIPKNNTKKRINSFEGIYFIGENFSSIVSSNQKRLQLNPILSEKYRNNTLLSLTGKKNSTVLNSTKTYTSTNECLQSINLNTQSVASCISTKKIHNSMNGFGKAGWTIDKMNIRFFKMDKEDWLSRTINTVIETSIYDPLQQKKISYRTTDIEVIDLTTGKKDKIQKITELNGNISFNILVKQHWYKRQRYFLKIIKFMTKSKELKIEKIVAINPWDYGFTHGFEVNHLTDIRTTCLKKTDKQNMSELFSKKTTQNLTDQQLQTIYKLFCHTTPSKKDTYNVAEKTKWNSIFNTFKDTLKIILKKPIIKADEAFYTKFTSTEDIKKPVAHIHLFRAINKYPTYLLDDSLNKELYYNVRFKLSPRITRHDDITRGQQNKGPIRDGVYIFQMAVLKNNQGRKNGYQSMVQPRKTFTRYSNADVKKAGTLPLFNCSINNPQCVTLEDFIVPPNNIPVILRDGKMKTDVNTLIKREHLLFANSKNILVFRILPADPKSIICKNNTSNCVLENADYTDSYEMAIDWKKTIKNIKPADTNNYDLYFYTYQTPFIPSEWVNWNITHESDTQFSDLNKIYSELSQKRQVKISDMETLRQTVFTPDKKQQKETIIDEQNLASLLTQNDSLLNAQQNFSQILQKNLQQTKLNGEKLQQKYTLSANTTPVKPTPFTAPLLLENPETNSIIPNSLAKKLTHSSTSLNSVPKSHNYCSKAKFQNTSYSVTSDSTKRCDIKPPAKNLLQKHISQFASTYALCTIDVNSNTPLFSKSCGDFTSPQVAQNTFLKDLNTQIKTINKIKKTIAHQNSKKWYLNVFKKASDNTQPSIASSFQSDDNNSYYFKEKLNNMPQLPFLNPEDLKNIIESNFDTYNVNDIKKSAFLHSLCGFWFKDFLSSKYTTANLLLDGFKQATKKTFYYKLKGIMPSFSAENDNSLTSINKELQTISVQYKSYLQENNLNGTIDNVHNWLNNKPGYTLNSSFHQDLYNKFSAIKDTAIFTNMYPRWAYKTITTRPAMFFPKKPYPNHQYFNAEVYLKEATNVDRPAGSKKVHNPEDEHPFRKCINNPSHFFGFEKKVIVGSINDNLKYGTQNGTGGELTSITVAENFLMNTQKDQGSNQGLESSIGSSLNLLTIPLSFLAGGFANTFFKTTLGIGQKLFRLASASTLVSLSALAGNAKFSYRSYEGTGKRRLLSIHVGEGVTLISEHSPIRIPLKTYKQCLVIRPRFSAFESHTKKYQHIWHESKKIIQSIYTNIGLLLCTEGTNKNYAIQEDFYYIYPDYPINGLTLDPKNHRNKPFSIQLRGKAEYKKFINNLNCDVSENINQLKENKECRDISGNYEYLFSKYIEFSDNLKKGFLMPKMFHLTGDSPGVHSPYSPEKDKDLTANPNALQKIFNWISDLQFMDTEIEKIVNKQNR